MILGLTGLKGSGKDTFAAALVANHDFTRFAFADVLKESAAAALGCTVEDLERLKNNENAYVQLVDCSPRAGEEMVGIWTGPQVAAAVSVREFLQRYGTEAHRDIFGQDFWVEHTMAQVSAQNAVITDARFENEQKAIRERGGWIIRIDRNTEPIGLEREGWDIPPADSHASENVEHGLTHVVVPNNGTIADLAMAARNVVKGIRLGQLSRS